MIVESVEEKDMW